MTPRTHVLRFTVGDQAPVDLDIFQLDLDESIALETLIGRSYRDLTLAVEADDTLALKVFYWVARRKAGHEVAFTDPSNAPKWADFTCEHNPTD
jgi:hypothetical protein